MTLLPPRARRALAIVSAVAVSAGLAVSTSGCDDSLAAPGIGTSAQTTDALFLLPANASVYGMTNLAAARQSNALDAALGGTGLGMVSGRGSADFDEFVRMTGFDPSTDLDRVYLAGMPGDAKRLALVAYGRFDRDRIEQFLATQDEAEVEVSEANGIPLYLATDDDGTRGGFALANSQMVLAGDEATLREMVGRLGTTGRAPDAELQGLFDRVTFPDGAWFVARGLDQAGLEIPEDAPPSALAARAADGFVVSMAFEDTGVPVRAFVSTKPETSTADVADVIRGGISAARVGLKDQPSALDVLDDVVVEAEADGVRVEGFMTTEFLASTRP